jgi:hypothetical protein
VLAIVAGATLMLGLAVEEPVEYAHGDPGVKVGQ